MTRRTIRLTLAPTKRTDLLCICCGKFFADLAIVQPGRIDAKQADDDAQAGVHRGVCLRALHTKRAVTPNPPAFGVPRGTS